MNLASQNEVSLRLMHKAGFICFFVYAWATVLKTMQRYNDRPRNWNLEPELESLIILENYRTKLNLLRKIHM